MRSCMQPFLMIKIMWNGSLSCTAVASESYKSYSNQKLIVECIRSTVVGIQTINFIINLFVIRCISGTTGATCSWWCRENATVLRSLPVHYNGHNWKWMNAINRVDTVSLYYSIYRVVIFKISNWYFVYSILFRDEKRLCARCSRPSNESRRHILYGSLQAKLISTDFDPYKFSMHVTIGLDYGNRQRWIRKMNQRMAEI